MSRQPCILQTMNQPTPNPPLLTPSPQPLELGAASLGAPAPAASCAPGGG